MSDVEVTGTIVAARPGVALDPRAVHAADWDAGHARQLAVEIWLTSKPSAHTRDAYRRDIAKWWDWCDDLAIPVNDARRGDVDGWADHLIASGLSPASVARTVSTVSSFYEYWFTEDVVSRNPAKHATRPNVSRDPGSIALTEYQCAVLMNYVAQLAERGDLRPAVIVRLLAETGMRVSELCGAQVASLAMSSGVHALAVVRKGGKTQLLAIATDTYNLIMVYLDGRTEGPLIQTRRTETPGPVGRSYVRDLVKRMARESGLPPEIGNRISPHSFRHSAATLLSMYGIPVVEIQQLLGHGTIVSTQRYIHASEGLKGSPTHVLAQRLDLAAGKLSAD